MPSAVAASGASIDVAIAQAPLHQFELTYDFLRSTFAIGEFQTLMGFFLSMQGTVGRFLFSNPDDYTVTGQHIATGDGTTTQFQIVRTFGSIAAGASTEPVGAIDTLATINVYLNGVLQSPSSYTLVVTTLCNQMIVFGSAPGAGVIVSADFQYLYYCRFADNQYTFEKNYNQIWSLQKVTLQSCRANA